MLGGGGGRVESGGMGDGDLRSWSSGHKVPGVLIGLQIIRWIHNHPSHTTYDVSRDRTDRVSPALFGVTRSPTLREATCPDWPWKGGGGGGLR